MKKNGFTLIETLMALLIFSIIAVSIHSVFRTGIQAWREGTIWAVENQAARNFFFQLSQDLRNSLCYGEKYPWQADAHSMTFMTLQNNVSTEAPSGKRLVRVRYHYDESSQNLFRTVAGQKEGFNPKNKEPEVLMEGIENLRFFYVYKPVYQEERYRWRDKWIFEKKVPRGVQVEMGGFKTTVFVPMGELMDEDKG